MKKKFQSILISLFVIVVFLTESNAQNFKSLDKSPHDIAYYRKSRVSNPIVKVVYGRPQKSEQQVFGNMVPYGEIWRTGANEATEVKFYQDVVFGNAKIKAGTYVLYTIPGKEEWEIILSSNLDVLGAFQYDSVFDVTRIKISTKKAEELEFFSIGFKEVNDSIQMVLAWDTTRIKIPIEINEEINNLKYVQTLEYEKTTKKHQI